MNYKIYVPELPEERIERFARKSKVGTFWVNDWGGGADIDTDGAVLPVRYRRKRFFLKRSYHITNVPVIWDLELEVIDDYTKPVTEIPKLQIPVGWWIDNDLYESGYDYGDIENYKSNLDDLAWQSVDSVWKKYMTDKLNDVLTKLIDNEICHQVESKREAINQMLKENKGLVEV